MDKFAKGSPKPRIRRTCAILSKGGTCLPWAAYSCDAFWYALDHPYSSAKKCGKQFDKVGSMVDLQHRSGTSIFAAGPLGYQPNGARKLKKPDEHLEHDEPYNDPLQPLAVVDVMLVLKHVQHTFRDF